MSSTGTGWREISCDCGTYWELQSNLPDFVYHESSVGIVTRLRAGWTGLQFLAGQGIFSVVQNVEAGCRAHPASCWVPRGKAARVWNWPFSAEGKNERTYTSALPIRLLGVERENVAFTFSCMFMYRQMVCVHYSDTALCLAVQLNPVYVCHKTTLHTDTTISCVKCFSRNGEFK